MLIRVDGPEAELLKLCRQSVHDRTRLSQLLTDSIAQVRRFEEDCSRVAREILDLSTHFEYSSFARLVVSSQGKILRCNALASRMLNAPQDLMGSNLLEQLAPESRSASRIRLKACTARRKPGLWSVRTRAGCRFNLHGRCLNSHRGPLVELKLAKPGPASSAPIALETVLQNLAQGLLLADRMGKIWFQNDSALQLLGLDLRGWRLSQIGELREKLQVVKLADGFLVTIPILPSSLEASRQLDVVWESQRLALGILMDQELVLHFRCLVELAAALEEGLAGNEAYSACAEQLVELSQRCLARAAVLKRGLYPPELERAGLLGSLRELARTTEEAFSLRCMVRGMQARFDERSALHLFRVAQEAVTNAVKHAAASQIEISLEQDGQGTWLEIYDNGLGIGATGPDLRGFGLRSMRHHAELMEGVLQVSSSPGQGTRIRCWAPSRAGGGEPSREGDSPPPAGIQT